MSLGEQTICRIRYAICAEERDRTNAMFSQDIPWAANLQIDLVLDSPGNCDVQDPVRSTEPSLKCHQISFFWTRSRLCFHCDALD